MDFLRQHGAVTLSAEICAISTADMQEKEKNLSNNGALRVFTLGACAAGLLFWLYTFWHIANLPVGDGSGFQWIAEMPLTGITLACMVPALLLSISNRALPVAAGLAGAGLVLYAVLWMQLLREFQPG